MPGLVAAVAVLAVVAVLPVVAVPAAGPGSPVVDRLRGLPRPAQDVPVPEPGTVALRVAVPLGAGGLEDVDLGDVARGGMDLGEMAEGEPVAPAGPGRGAGLVGGHAEGGREGAVGGVGDGGVAVPPPVRPRNAVEHLVQHPRAGQVADRVTGGVCDLADEVPDRWSGCSPGGSPGG